VIAIALACASTTDAKTTAAPANDVFANAQIVSGSSGTATGSNKSATKESGEPNHAGNSGGASIWYRWVAPSTGTASIDTVGSSFDTLLAVYTGNAVNTLTTIASNDDCCGGRQSKVSFPAVSGTTYQIAVDGYNKATGSVTLNWSQSAPPANDLFANAQIVFGSSGTATGSNVGATKESGEPNHGGNAGGASIWYRWTAPATGTATIDTSGSSFDTLLAVYTGSAVNALTTIASNDDAPGVQTSKVAFPAASGTTYQIAVDGYNAKTGSATLNWSQTAPLANDMFANAQVLSGTSGTATGTNVGATKEAGEPNHAGNAGGVSVWYRWTAAASGSVTIDTIGSSFDTLLGVYTGGAVNQLTAIASNDDCCGGRQSKVTFTAAAGMTYRIAVDGYNKATGAVTLDWAQTAPPPADDPFANAQVVSGPSGSVTGSNANATKEPGEPNHAGNAGGASIWYRWTAPATGTATIDTSGSGFNTLLGIYTGSAVNALTTIASNDDAPGVTTSRVSFSALPGTTYQIAVDGSGGATGSVTLNWSLAGQSGDPVLVAAGDQHACDGTGDDQTAALLGPLAPQFVVPLGDASGEYGYLSEYTGCYDATWGAFKAVSYPAPGNHDYEGDSTAAGYFTYFGAAAGTPGQGWYSYDVGAWHVIALNSNCGLVGGCGAGSPEVQWVKQDLAAHPAACTLAYFHHPLFTSTPEPGYNGPVDSIFQALYNGGADVVLNAHSKSYERFAPQDPSGHANPAYGIREFIVGTGGEPLDPTNTHAANSEAWQASTLGVLKLTLHATSYDWQFVPVPGSSYSDSGTGSCHSDLPPNVQKTPSPGIPKPPPPPGPKPPPAPAPGGPPRQGR
jgi:Bacterial pre-peptidase C-terminal domain